jgi:hypothetical protein
MEASYIDPEKVSLRTLADGQVIDEFDQEFSRCLENIMDEKTDVRKKRSVTLKIILEPEETRDFAHASIQCSSSLAPRHIHAAQLYIGRDIDGTPMAQQKRFQQQTFDDYLENRAREDQEAGS